MKKLSLLLICFAGLQTLSAQKWCPPGATWYFQAINWYSSTDSSQPQEIIGYDKASYSKDTLVNSLNVKQITDTGYYENYNQSISVYPPIYTYSSGDTVYFLNNASFLPYFYFGCHTGDTLIVPWYNIRMIAIHVDSTGVMIINGDSLRFYDYSAIDSPYNCVHVVGGLSNGRIIEHIGNFTTGPGNNSFNFDFSCLEYEAGYYFHCYYDDSFALYSTDSINSCTYILTSIRDIPAPVEFSLAPNLAVSYCQLRLSHTGKVYSAAVYDLSGRQMLTLFTRQFVSDFDFNTSALASGLYFVKVTDEAGNFAVAKLMKE